jgi:hypothetical protein
MYGTSLSSALAVDASSARQRAIKVFIVDILLFVVASDATKEVVVVFDHLVLELDFPTDFAGLGFEAVSRHSTALPCKVDPAIYHGRYWNRSAPGG